MKGKTFYLHFRHLGRSIGIYCTSSASHCRTRCSIWSAFDYGLMCASWWLHPHWHHDRMGKDLMTDPVILRRNYAAAAIDQSVRQACKHIMTISSSTLPRYQKTKMQVQTLIAKLPTSTGGIPKPLLTDISLSKQHSEKSKPASYKILPTSARNQHQLLMTMNWTRIPQNRLLNW